MTIDQFINLLATLTLIEMMISQGLGVSIDQVTHVAANRRLIASAAIANYLLVPALAVGLLMWFGAPTMVSAGILIAAICPGAPYGPPFTGLARGNTVIATGLMIVLAASSAILAPLLLRVLLPFIAKGQAIEINVGKMLAALMLSQLLPLLIGIALRARRPALAERLLKPSRVLSMVLNLATLGVILSVHFQMLASIRWEAYAGMAALVVGALLAGAISGGPGGENRRTLAITTAVRNVGVGLVIVTGSFAGTPAVTAATAYAIFQTMLVALLAVAWGRTVKQTVA